MESFKGRVAVVTGGASGIGRALGFALAREGARVALADIDQGRLDTVAAEIVAETGAEVRGFQVDVTRPGLFRPWPMPSGGPSARSICCSIMPEWD